MRGLLFLWILFASGLTAQETIPRFVFKFNAAPLINVYKQAAAVSADFRLAPRLSVDAGAGSFLSSSIFANEAGESYTGLRLRGGIKYYYHVSRSENLHLGLEGKYQDIRNITARSALRQGGQYVEILLHERRIQTRGATFRMGFQYFLGKSNRLALEPFFGLGGMTHTVTRDLPPDAELVEPRGLFNNFELQEGETRSLDLVLGFNIGWCIW